jgi:transcriptional regulator with XRE-family HTH domain
MNEPRKVSENIGRRVAELRLNLGLTQDGLAEKADVTGGYIRQIEGARKDMRISTLCRIADMLDCDIATLFTPAKSVKPKPGRPRKLSKNVTKKRKATA